MKKLLIIIAILATFLAACDNRTADDPTMEFTSNKNFIFQTNVNSENKVNFSIKLSKSNYANKAIDLSYDPDLGTAFEEVNNDGIATKTYTNSKGLANFAFLTNIRTSVSLPFTVNISAIVHKFKDVHQTLSFKVYKAPEVEIFSTPDVASNFSTIDLRFKVNNSTKLDDLEVKFTTSGGELVNEIVKTNSQGIAETQLKTANAIDDITVTANLVRSAHTSATKIIRIQ